MNTVLSDYSVSSSERALERTNGLTCKFLDIELVITLTLYSLVTQGLETFFDEAIAKPNMSNLLQISVDGPYTNWKFY